MTALTFDREHDLVAAVVAMAQHNGWRDVHVRLGGERSLTDWSRLLNNDAIGFPDLLLIHPNAARLVAAELKTNTGRLTALQKKWLHDLKAAGVETYVWRALELVREERTSQPSTAESPGHNSAEGVRVTSPEDQSCQIVHGGRMMTTPTDIVLSRLRRVRSTSGRGFMAECPAHADSVPSLSVTKGQDGRVLVHCFAGCDTAAVLYAIGLSFSDLF